MVDHGAQRFQGERRGVVLMYSLIINLDSGSPLVAVENLMV